MKVWFAVSVALIIATWGVHAWAEDEPNSDVMSWRDISFFLLFGTTAVNWIVFAIAALWRSLI